MKAFSLRIYLLACTCLFLFVHLMSQNDINNKIDLLLGYLLCINIITTIGYGYLLAKKRAYIIDDPGKKSIGLFGSSKWLMVWLTVSILYLAGMLLYNQINPISLFPFLVAYVVILLLILILNAAFNDKMLFTQTQQ